MVGGVGSEYSCVSLVSREVVFRGDIVPQHEVVRIDMRLNCPGTWDMVPPAFTFTPPDGLKQSMTVLDLNNVFPFTVDWSDVGVVVSVFWDSFADDVDPNVGVDYAICVGIIQPVGPTPIGSDPEDDEDPPWYQPPPPDPDPPAITTGVDAGGIGDPGGVITTGVEAYPTGIISLSPDSFGAPDPGGTTIPNWPRPRFPNSLNTGNNTGNNIAEIPSTTLHSPYLERPLVRVRPVDRLDGAQDGYINAPRFNGPNDTPSTSTPIVPISERREVIPGTVYKPNSPAGFRPGGTIYTPGPGQITLVPGEIVPDSGVVDLSGQPEGVYWSPDTDSLIGVSSEVIPVTLTGYPEIGDVLDQGSIRPNPNVDLIAREQAGDSARVDSAIYKIQPPVAGRRLQPVPMVPLDDPLALLSDGSPSSPGSIVTEGPAGDAPVAAIRIFETPAIPLDGIGPDILSVSLGSSVSPTDIPQDYLGEAPAIFPIDPFVVAGSATSYGLTYGVGDLRTTTDIIPGIALAKKETIGDVSISVDAYPNHIMQSDKVSVVAVNIRNRSAHTELNGLTLTIGVVDSSLNYTKLTSQELNVKAKNDTAISIPIPKKFPPGPMQFVGIAQASNGDILLATSTAGYILPPGITLHGYQSQDQLPSSVKEVLGITDAKNPVWEGRAYPFKNPLPSKDFTATSSVVAGAVKISQEGANRGFNSKVTVTIDPLGTPSVFTFTNRAKIGGADLFPGSHDTAFKVGNISIGDTVRICIENQKNETDPRYSWRLFGTGITEKTGLTFTAVGDGTHMAGTIGTPLANARIRVHNTRTASEIPLRTDVSGQAIIPLDSGASGDSTLVFDANSGDDIYILQPGIAGLFTITEDIIATGTVGEDVGDILPPTGAVVIPDITDLSPIIPPSIGTDIIIRDGAISFVGEESIGDGFIVVVEPDPIPPDGAATPEPDPPPPPDDIPSPIIEMACVEPEEVLTWETSIISICQRPSNPCIVDITAQITGQGLFSLVPELCMFSLDTTDGYDGTWYHLVPIWNDSSFSGIEVFQVTQSQTFNFVSDMCDHLSSFFSEDTIYFRLTFAQVNCDLSQWGVT